MPASAVTSVFSHDPPLALLVDYDADTRQMYGEFLRSVRYATDEAEDGPTALAKALTSRPDVVVTETRLRGIDGYELCRMLRDDRDVKDVRIVMVTASAFPSDLARAEASGADAVLVKPCLPHVLAETIQRLLARNIELRGRAARAVATSALAIQRAYQTVDATRAARAKLSRTHRRGDTTAPPLPPPVLSCPQCDAPLRYVKSHVGGVNVKNQEQWDYYECMKRCGTFEFRQRTRKLRLLA